MKMRISTKIGLFSSNNKEEHRQALMTAGTSSSVSVSQQMVVARQPLLPEEVDQEDAALLPHPSAGKRKMYEEETSIREGVVELPAMAPAFSNISFSGATVIVNFDAGNIHHNTASNMTASNEILQQQSSSAAPEEAARKKLRQ